MSLLMANVFYGIDARAYAAHHMELFVAAPSVAEMGLPSPDEGRAPTHLMIFTELEKRFNALHMGASEEPVRIGSGAAYVFGLGLGFHLKPYMIETQCRSLVIIEPEPMFLVLSMYFIDWVEIFKYADNKIVFVFETLPDYAFNAARRYTGAMNMGVQQLIYYTQHYK
ncbi:hypothetical protein, partial [Elstera litoralis]